METITMRTNTRSPRRERPRERARVRERGQVLLLTAIVLAALLFSLVIVSNGIMHTTVENTNDESTSNTIEAVDTVTDNLARETQYSTRAANTAEYETSGDAVTEVQRDVTAVTRDDAVHAQNRHANTRVSTPEDSVTVEPAWVIQQVTESTFTPADDPREPGDAGWRLGAFNGVRDFTMTVTSASSFNASGTDGADDVFSMQIQHVNTTDEEEDDVEDDEVWEVFVFDNPSEPGVSIGSSTDSDGNPVADCTVTETPVKIEWDTMTVNGDQCTDDGDEELVFAEPLTTATEDEDEELVSVVFKGDSEITGTYRLIAGQGNDAELIGRPNGVFTNELVRDTTSGDEADDALPTAYDGVYTARVTVQAATRDVTVTRVVDSRTTQPEATRGTWSWEH